MGRAADYDGDGAVPEGLWFARFRRATQSKRGIARLKEIAAILDAMPQKRLIAEALTKEGDCCFVGAVCKAKNVEMTEGECDIFDTASAGKDAGIPWTLAWEMAALNDEKLRNLTPEDRWIAARAWVDDLLRKTTAAV
jgi:hypothetical protein